MTPEQRSDKLTAAHLLLDALVAVSNPDHTPENNGPALYTAMEAIVLNRQVIKFKRDHTTPAGFGVDATPLVYGALEVAMWLLREVERATAADPLDVLVALRDQLTTWAAEENPAPPN